MVIAVILFYLNSNKTVDMQFTSGDCNRSEANVSRKTITEINWINENSVEIKGFYFTTCGNKLEKGIYFINNSNIILKPKEVGDSLANCICPHKVIYKITGLKKENSYNFNFYE